MKKRLLAAIMSLCMIVSLLPVSAFAVEDPVTSAAAVDSVRTAKDSPVQITKTVSEPDDSGDYTLKLESYVTGKVTSTAPTPMDIVLVLDVSGSMKETFSSITTGVNYKRTNDENEDIYRDFQRNQYYYSEDNGQTVYPIIDVDRHWFYGVWVYTYTYQMANGQTGTYQSRRKWKRARSNL